MGIKQETRSKHNRTTHLVVVDIIIIVTEQGVADLRGRSPHERAEMIIEQCAHPEYRDLLRRYLKLGGDAHTPQSLDNAYAFHRAFLAGGDMRQAALSGS
ncbi:MAG: acetyl-CoA hydrolase/transferase C-terminal domain-containing protein [Chthoniobacterales bacterium]